MRLMKEQTGRTTGSKTASRLRVTLIVTQIALSLALLVVSGLFAKSLYRLNNTNLGMTTDNIITFGVSPVPNGYTHQQAMLFFERLEDELAAIPGVSGFTSSQFRMFTGASVGMDINADVASRATHAKSTVRRPAATHCSSAGAERRPADTAG